MLNTYITMVFITKKLSSGESIKIAQMVNGKFYAKINYQPFEAHLSVDKELLLCKAVSLCVLISSYKLLLSLCPELKLATDSVASLESRLMARRTMGLC